MPRNIALEENRRSTKSVLLIGCPVDDLEAGFQVVHKTDEALTPISNQEQEDTSNTTKAHDKKFIKIQAR